MNQPLDDALDRITAALLAKDMDLFEQTMLELTNGGLGADIAGLLAAAALQKLPADIQAWWNEPCECDIQAPMPPGHTHN